MTPAPPRSVCVVGLGKIGLPLATQFASRGLETVGVDIDPRVVDLVNEGRAPFPGEAHLAERLADAVDRGLLRATTDASSAVSGVDVVVVVVPLVVDGDGRPDFRNLDDATDAVGRALRPGTLVLYETTVPVHTTRGRFAPRLAELSGLALGDELLVAFSPERVYSGRIFADLRRYPKLVGGLDAASARRAAQFYELALEFDERPELDRPNGVWDLGTAEAAELAKLAETTYRDINIAFANELAVFAEGAGVDVFAVIEAANSQPFSHIHGPGIAVGGHCIPVYPRLYLSNAPDALLPATARKVNESMPGHAVDRLDEALDGLADRSVVVLGLTYRGGVKETAFSGAFPLAEELTRRGARVGVHDPLYTDDEIAALGLVPAHLQRDRFDAAVIQADHTQYLALRPSDLPGVRVLLDGRRITRPEDWRSAGVLHLQHGSAPGH